MRHNPGIYLVTTPFITAKRHKIVTPPPPVYCMSLRIGGEFLAISTEYREQLKHRVALIEVEKYAK